MTSREPSQPVFMIDAGLDHLAPIGDIHLVAESGPVKARTVRIHPDAGPCVSGYRSGPAGYRRPTGTVSTLSPVHE